MDRKKEVIVTTKNQKNENKDALEKSNYALIRDLKPDKTSLEKSKIDLCLIKK